MSVGIEALAGRPTGPCERCTIRPAQHWWVGGGDAIALAHGQVWAWCERCCVEEQVRHAEEQAARLPGLRTRLAELVDSSSGHVEPGPGGNGT